MDLTRNNYSNSFALELSKIQVSFNDTEVLRALTFNLEAGEILCLLGPSGCGKTTALKTIAGLISPTSGTINLFGTPVFSNTGHTSGVKSGINVPAEKRSIGFIFQDYALFPHMTVSQNIAYGLSHLTKQEKQKRIEESLSLVELPDMQKRYPHELSGGQQQRIAVARALAPKPQLLLMDEPFSNIDGQVKRRMMADLRKLLKKHQVSCIFVTHAKEEAFAFADKTAVMVSGNIEQLDTPATVFNHPQNLAVAEFMESGNLAPIKTCEEILGTINPLWLSENHNTENTALKGDKSSGFWLFKPQHLIINKSNTDSRVSLVDSTYIGRGYQYEIVIQLDSGAASVEPNEIMTWKVEHETDLGLKVGDSLSLAYSLQPHWMPN